MAATSGERPWGAGDADEDQARRDLKADLYREVMDEVQRELFASDVVAEHDRVAGMQAMSAAVQQEVHRLRAELSATQRALREAVVQGEHLRRSAATSRDGDGQILAEAHRAILVDLLGQGRCLGLGVVVYAPPPSGAEAQELSVDTPLHEGPWCHAAVPLTRDEVLSGEMEWEAEHPFLLARDDDGRCRYLDPQAGCCALEDRRPGACRQRALARHRAQGSGGGGPDPVRED